MDKSEHVSLFIRLRGGASGVGGTGALFTGVDVAKGDVLGGVSMQLEDVDNALSSVATLTSKRSLSPSQEALLGSRFAFS